MPSTFPKTNVCNTFSPMTVSIISLETAMTAPVQGNVCVGDGRGIYGAIGTKHSLPPWAVTNGEWRDGSNSLLKSRR